MSRKIFLALFTHESFPTALQRIFRLVLLDTETNSNLRISESLLAVLVALSASNLPT